ncbi:MAG TPA: VOC family protein [Acidimicrobiales bacterium]|nr:VOC family protein [Acidimicrobiales bacterium]
MLHHVTLWVPDLERAEESWSWLLGELEYVPDRSIDNVLLLRHWTGFSVALEQSADMVPGMLHSRLRPGLNHMAFVVRSGDVLHELLERASDHGWMALPFERHPIAGGAKVAYLEDKDGFEVELVVTAS